MMIQAKSFFAGMFICFVLFAATAMKNISFNKNETNILHSQEHIEKQISEVDQNMLKQIHCMAENLYFEARGEPLLGQIAVNNVVMNRVNDPAKRFGNTPCEVISQITFNKRKKKVCQFSWKCERNKIIKDHEKFLALKNLSRYTYNGALEDVTQGAKFYHATYVNPKWNLERVTKIGQHIFYREYKKEAKRNELNVKNENSL